MININGLENINLGELKEIFKCNKLSIKEAMPPMREFRDKHQLDDKQALVAFGISKTIFSG